MREKLREIAGARRRFRGDFVRFGSKSNYKGPPKRTVLLTEVTDDATGETLADHLWFICGKQLDALDLEPGDCVAFDARVTSYEKGYRGHREDVWKPCEIDYRLSFPTKFVKLNR